MLSLPLPQEAFWEAVSVLFGLRTTRHTLNLAAILRPDPDVLGAVRGPRT